MSDGRLHLRIPHNLKEQIQDYCLRHNVTVTSLVVRFFTTLIQEEERRKKQPIDAKQI